MKDQVFKKRRIIGDPNGSRDQKARFAKCQRTKQRNAARRELRATNPRYRYSQLKVWPLPEMPVSRVA